MGAAGTPTFHTGKPGGGAPSGPAGGDLTGFYPNPTLVASGVTPAFYGDSTHVARFSVDAKGRITFAQNVAISGGGGSGVIVDDEGTPLGTATTLNFVGAGVSVAFGGGTAVITIPGAISGADCT